VILILKGNSFHKKRLAFCLVKLGVFNRINNISIILEYELTGMQLWESP
jgi:hypothetical protein